MKVARWGNSLAVRLPREVADKLALKEGDQVVLKAAEGGVVEVARDSKRADALERLKSYSWSMPPGYRFDRNEIYDHVPTDGSRPSGRDD